MSIATPPQRLSPAPLGAARMAILVPIIDRLPSPSKRPAMPLLAELVDILTHAAIDMALLAELGRTASLKRRVGQCWFPCPGRHPVHGRLAHTVFHKNRGCGAGLLFCGGVCRSPSCGSAAPPQSGFSRSVRFASPGCSGPAILIMALPPPAGCPHPASPSRP